MLRYRQHKRDSTVIQAEWLTDFSIAKLGSLSFYRIARSRWEIEPGAVRTAGSTPSLFDNSVAFCGVNSPPAPRRRSRLGRNAASPTTQIHSTAPISVSRQSRDCWRGIPSPFG